MKGVQRANTKMNSKGGYYNKASGNKVGYQDIANHYGNKEQASKGSLGESFSDKKGHNKDSKTTGYHKVYYKDDYKKDHSFYDKADRRGHFKKYSDYDAKDDAQQGAFDKGGHYDNGFKGNVYKAKGLSDKSRFVDESSGHTGAAGKQKYYQNNSEYANKARKEFGKEQGFSDDDKYSVGQ
ncbi:hypothetical protein NQ314_020396 [Rhamnusium bicolor]|uniref:Uncharacterized protein n=1 Tax=Rhamnusium bicolor TaxID=1586634 RepID=A0AAV8WLA8_9CUCU|nr:hypothetical protein NQ314_020396 [Rhamnusium bicolor]